MNALFIGLGGLVGVYCRYTLAYRFASFSYRQLITITMITNLLACFLIGLFLTTAFNSFYFQIFSQSFLSAFSTYSTYNYELLKRLSSKKSQAILYFFITLSLSFAAFYLGLIV